MSQGRILAPFQEMCAMRWVMQMCVMCAASTLAGAADGQTTQWTRLQAIGPSGRMAHAMAYDSGRGVTVLFGGQPSNPGALGDTWEWNGATWAQRATTGPHGQAGHAMAYDSARGVTVLVGASTTTGFCETWEWDGSAWSLRSTTGVFRRSGHAMAYDSARGVTVLFGGESGGGSEFGDTWEWNGAAWTQRATTGPSGRTVAGMTYDSARHVCVLFGGRTQTPPDFDGGDTWEWNGTAWTQRATTGPSPRDAFAMAYDSARGVSVVYGGYRPFVSQLQNAETWEWNGTAWAQSAVSGPGERSATAMAYDPVRGGMVLFGGTGAGAVGSGATDTWGLTGICTAPTFTQQGASGSTCPGAMWTFQVAAGPGPLTYQWRQQSPSVPIPGANGPSLTVPVALGYQGFDCVVWNSCGAAVSQLVYVAGCKPDFSCNGRVDVQDIFDFLTLWFQGDPRADYNGENGVGVADIFSFIAAWFQGSC